MVGSRSGTPVPEKTEADPDGDRDAEDADVDSDGEEANGGVSDEDIEDVIDQTTPKARPAMVMSRGQRVPSDNAIVQIAGQGELEEPSRDPGDATLRRIPAPMRQGSQTGGEPRAPHNGGRDEESRGRAISRWRLRDRTRGGRPYRRRTRKKKGKGGTEKRGDRDDGGRRERTLTLRESTGAEGGTRETREHDSLSSCSQNFVRKISKMIKTFERRYLWVINDERRPT